MVANGPVQVTIDDYNVSLLDRPPSGPKVDVWALGIILMEIILVSFPEVSISLLVITCLIRCIILVDFTKFEATSLNYILIFSFNSENVFIAILCGMSVNDLLLR